MTKRVTGLESFVAERVSVARELRGFNKRELAKRLGLAESSYNPYELKRIPFTLAMLERLVPKPKRWPARPVNGTNGTSKNPRRSG